MVPVAYSMCTVEGHRDKPTPAIGRVRRAWQRSTVAASLRDEMSIWVAASREVRGRVIECRQRIYCDARSVDNAHLT